MGRLVMALVVGLACSVSAWGGSHKMLTFSHIFVVEKREGAELLGSKDVDVFDATANVNRAFLVGDFGFSGYGYSTFDHSLENPDARWSNYRDAPTNLQVN